MLALIACLYAYEIAISSTVSPKNYVLTQQICLIATVIWRKCDAAQIMFYINIMTNNLQWIYPLIVHCQFNVQIVLSASAKDEFSAFSFQYPVASNTYILVKVEQVKEG